MFKKFRKRDYIIFFLIDFVIYAVSLINPTLKHWLALMLASALNALILGTATNLIFKKKPQV